jgi:hypothetical protein
MTTSGPRSAPGDAAPVEHRLERGELLYFPICPFPLPQGDDLRFLLDQRLATGFLHLRHKNISFDPATGRVSGYRRRSNEQGQRLRGLLAGFSGVATAWLARLLPHYPPGWRLDRATLRTEEEATRPLRLTARNDLLHLDAFPTRPTQGWRILRLFANIDPTDPRVWVTSETIDTLLPRYGVLAGLPTSGAVGWGESLRAQLLRFLQPGREPRSAYDAFMLRLHDHLKLSDVFQEKAPRRFWSFPPGSAWLVMTDALSHAELRGRFALEHSYFVSPQMLLLPGESPAALLERASGTEVLGRAA